jgi:hypothetical protein
MQQVLHNCPTARWTIYADGVGSFILSIILDTFKKRGLRYLHEPQDESTHGRSKKESLIRQAGSARSLFIFLTIGKERF